MPSPTGREPPQDSTASPVELRRSIRNGAWTANTSGLAPGYLQCNIVIVPGQAAADFARFCEYNPKPCPLIAQSEPGDPRLPTLGDIDIRSDVPAYQIIRHGQVDAECHDIKALWQDDFVAFALGCSFSFEDALQDAGLEIRNISQGVNVPMYNTELDCEPAGVFGGKMVVSMRPFKPADIVRVADLCSRYPAAHGAPIHMGDPGLIGITDIAQPDYGDRVTIQDEELPLFWACGVTGQRALINAALPMAITHRPGAMLISDLRNEDLAVH